MDTLGLPSQNNSIKLQLTVLSFLQYFVWGAWLIPFSTYWFSHENWSSQEFGEVFSTMGIAAIFMPTIIGVLADKWINAEKLYGILHLLYGVCLIILGQEYGKEYIFWIMLFSMFFYMPTIALSNSISFSILKRNNLNEVKTFPVIRVWGTIGFIIAMWVTNLSGNKASANQFIIGGVTAIILGGLSFFLPKCPPTKQSNKKSNWMDSFGLSSFSILKEKKMLLFFLFSLLLGASLQLTNAYGDVFIDDFKFFPRYVDSFAVKYSTIILSISQISETLFILAIPFFLRKFGIKKVMLISMIAWVFRFGLLAFSNPNPYDGLWLIILSCIIYGMAFDFFNISGSLFVNSAVPLEKRSSAQGLFMMTTNGFGAVIGSKLAGIIIAKYFTLKFVQIDTLSKYLKTSPNNPIFQKFLEKKEIIINQSGHFDKIVELKMWPSIWLSFAAYALVVAILFAVLFKHKHDPNEIGVISH
jgi:NHS family xanthosine MFS transporter